MQCHVMILNMKGTTYTFYELEKRKGTIKEKTETRKTNRERKRKKMKAKTRRNNLSCPPPRRRGGQHLKKNELEKRKKITKTPLLVNRVRQRTKEKITKGK